MKNKYIIFNTFVTLIALILMFSLGIVVTKNNNINQAKDEIEQITKIYVSQYSNDIDYSKSVDDNLRITIIDSTGKVIVDSSIDSTSLDNHINREEIIAALENNPRTIIRKSDTTNLEMIYYALKVDVNDDYLFFRVSMPISNVTNYVVSVIPLMLLILLCSLTVSAIISYIFSINIVKPLELVKTNLANINNGKYTTILPNTSDDDINRILLEINDLGDKLNNSIKDLKESHIKLDYVLNNILNGIVTFDDKEKIQLVNNSALKIFDIDNYINKTLSYLSLDLDFLSKIRTCVNNNENAIFEYFLNGKYYLCSLNKVDDDLYILVLNDINENKCNEKIRSEFFANASHELKTPLTSIKGFNEMAIYKNKDDSIDKYLKNIEKEANRILILLDDMLKLSKLENVVIINNNEIDLYKLSNEIKDELEILWESKNITVDITGKAIIKGSKEHFYELIKNLFENSIKYNFENGFVRIDLEETKEKIVLKVIDNGIGIEKKDQGRIFERFYRVNKSRSRSTGGTGLGLAIVKHIVQLYQGDILVNSSIGKGTEIIVSLKK